MTFGSPITSRSTQDGLNQALAPRNTAGISAKHGYMPIHCYRLILTALPVAITDTGGTIGGHGSVILADLPQGFHGIVGASGRLTVTRVGTNITATATVKLGIGTAAVSAADANLTSTECNFAGAVNTGTAMVAGAVTFNVVQDALTFQIAGTLTESDLRNAGSLTATTPVYLNFHVADAGITANDSVLVTGYVDLIYYMWHNRNVIGTDGVALP